MDVSLPQSRPSPAPRPWWRRLLNRAITWTLNTSLWFIVWFSMLALVIIFEFGGENWFNLPRSGAWALPGQLLLRTLIVLPLGIWILLIIHPIRTRWWLARQARRLARAALPRRKSASLSSATPADDQPSAPSAPERQPLLELTPPPRPLSRRRFLAETALFGGVMADAMFIEPYLIETVEVEMPIANLPERFHGLTIAQLSDMHVNQFTTAADLDRAVDVINGLNPDLVLLTGDFVDSNAALAHEATFPFARLRAKEGVFSVVGNHDYYTGKIDDIKRAIKRQDLGLLFNDHTTLRRGADTLTLIGLDDPAHSRGVSISMENVRASFRMLEGLKTSGPRLMMVHSPVLTPALAQRRAADLVLSGHTHGGQFRVPILVHELIKRTEFFVQGRYTVGETQLYVNRGYGFTGPPVRFRARPEVTLLRLVPAHG